MTTADEYRLKAAEFAEQGRLEASPTYKTELERLAQCYRNLAALADRNRHTRAIIECAKNGELDPIWLHQCARVALKA
jgi:hypothetical protein